MLCFLQFVFVLNASQHYTVYVVNMESNTVDHMDNLKMTAEKIPIAIKRANTLVWYFQLVCFRWLI